MKRRELRRYYKNLLIDNDFDKIDKNMFSDSNWFDMWHRHFDWDNLGSTSFKNRRPHLLKLLRHLRILKDLLKGRNAPFQVFAIIHDFDSGSDAIFIHSPNPNSETFPYKMENLGYQPTLSNPDLQAFINEIQGIQVRYSIGESPFCVLQIDGLGLPIESVTLVEII